MACMLGILAGCNGTPAGSTESSGDENGEPTPKESFETIAYFAFGWVKEESLEFYKACGYNTLLFCDTSWYYKPTSEAFANYQNNLLKTIEKAKEMGFKTYVEILSTLEQWNGAADMGNPMGQAFDPANAAKTAERLGYIRQVIQKFHVADGFTFYGGDPGGVLGITAQGGLQYYIDMAKEVKKMVNEIAPEAEFNLNLWAVSQFEQATVDPYKVDFWLAEDVNGRKIIDTEGLLGPDVGIEIPGHDYYRTLAFNLYNASGKKPETKFPIAEDVQNIKDTGCTRYWAYPHGLVPDISDDIRFNTNRIAYYLKNMSQIGMNGVIMGNASYISHNADLFAFAQIAQDPTMTAEEAMLKYAALLTDDEDSAKYLCEAMKFLNNYDVTMQNLPEEYALPLMETEATDVWKALELFRKARPNMDPDFPFEESPSIYMAKIQARLYAIRTTVRPEDAVDQADYLCTFEESVAGRYTAVADPAVTGNAGMMLLPKNGQYNLIDGKLSGLDVSAYASYGYVHLDVYSETDQKLRGYMMLSSDDLPIGVDEYWQYDFGGAVDLKKGWNHLSFRVAFGAQSKNPVNWKSLTQYRILFFNDTSEVVPIWLDNFYIANYEENVLPGDLK